MSLHSRLRILFPLILLAVVLLLLGAAQLARAQGIIVPPPVDPPPVQPPDDGPAPFPFPGVAGPVDVTLHSVDATVDGVVAEVHITQVFRNTTDRTLEATYVFPLPADAAIGDLQMTVDGQVLEGQVYKADEARRITDGILAWQGNERLKIGKVTEQDDDTIVIEIVTVDDSLVQRVAMNRTTGMITPAQ